MTNSLRKFESSFTVPAPLDAVTAFHFEPGILKILTPPLMIMQVHHFEPLADDSIAEFTMWMGPIPVYWKAVHSEVTSSGFTDTQVQGPMKSWRHTHRFRALDTNLTEVHDQIEYEHFGGLKGIWSRVLFPTPGLQALFAIRRWITRREVRRRQALHASSVSGKPNPSN